MSRTVKVVISAVGLALIIFLFFSFSGFKLTRNEQLSVTGLLTEIKQISQLNTVEMYFNEILDYSESLQIGDFVIPFTEKKFIFVIEAKVQSGVDLSTLTEDDVEIVDNKITLRLNHAEITSKEILKYQAYDEKDGLFNRVSSEDTLKTLNEFNVRLENQALEKDILTIAEDNARIALTGFLRLLGFEEIFITFE
ncbi:MAG: DUF4230 domain-containing protein [Erysipelothrix sp.]|jgi:hypothetical protein|nr:DUF4230 domain-containing protein [Erysipelothrix sp.]